MTEPFPRDDDGERDYERAARELFGEGGVSPRSPVYVNDGAETFAAVRVDVEVGTATFARLDVAVNRETWFVDLTTLWDDWMHDELTFRRRRFIEPHEGTYNSEREAVLSRTAVSSLADHAAGIAARNGVDLTDEVEEAVSEAYGVLDYDGPLAEVVEGDD